MTSLGDELLETLTELQAEAESMMLSACTIKRKIGEVFDRTTGKTVTTYSADLYSGKCRLKMRDVRTATTDVGGAVTYTMQDSMLSLPVSAATVVRVGDIATITASEVSPWLVGRQYVVQNIPATTLMTSARFTVTEVV